MNEVERIIEHYGTKGMKWGVRKRRNEAARAKKFAPSNDADRAAQIKTKAKGSGVKSLTNQEIREFTQRVQLERQFSNAAPSNMKKVSNLIGSLIGTRQTMDKVLDFSNSTTGKKIDAALKKPESQAS